MRRPLWRLWQRKQGTTAPGGQSEDLALPQPNAGLPDDVVSGDADRGSAGRSVPPLPEQPVLLTPAGTARPVRIGELLPARQQRWPLSVVRLPVIPKRAILAAGVCAGLAAPGIARHVAARMLLGGAQPATRGSVEGVLEITRIVYNGPLTPRAAEAISKALAAGRR